ncbi:hypothetical protein AB1Y20_020588 [Prymnesium parvum]|uniref:Myosin motor domain-containing protein n=1 Tax=Prymnesium parvum TaxID=97485 RepID=A0AB34JZS6_PRYPA
MIGKHVWCRDEETCWTRAEVTFAEGDKLSIYVEATDEVQCDVPLSAVCEVDPTHDANLADIVSLNNLHEAPILHLLHRRLHDNAIYTWAGADVLISINPYHAVPLYGTARCQQLAEQRGEEGAGEPHVYTLADKAYRDMQRSAANHSIVISGESGAGKTEASKRVIEYLAFASKRSREPPPAHALSPRGRAATAMAPRRARGATLDVRSPRASPRMSRGSGKTARPADDDEAVLAALCLSGGDRPLDGKRGATVGGAGARAASVRAARGGVERSESVGDGLGRVQVQPLLEDESVEAQVSLSLPALEAFGNAKTIRNNNSSRFGKFVRVEYDARGGISGASTLHFLLERSRVVEVSKRERNFHIFYMLCDAAMAAEGIPPELRLGELGLKPAAAYKYLSSDGKPVLVEGKSDVDDFRHLCLTLDRLGVQTAEQRDLYAVLAAILTLGNVELVPGEEGAGCTLASDGTVELAAAALGCAAAALERALTKRTIVVGGAEIISPLSAKDATFGRDSLAKAIYSDVFDWLVRVVNQRSGGGRPAKTHFIGVLDIFGFEILASNSFEQLCINYVNEMLQEYFNEMVFDAETALMASLGLPDIAVHVADNGPRLRLLATLFARLDDQAKNKQADDSTFLRNITAVAAEKSEWADVCRVDDRGGTFLIMHYAGDVTYNSVGFAAKNNDSLHADLISLISECSALKSLGGRAVDAKAAKTTVSGKLRLGIGTVSKLSTDRQKTGKGETPSAGSRVRSRGTARLVDPDESPSEEVEEPLMSILTNTTPHYVRCIKPNESKAAFGFSFPQVRTQLAYLGVLEVVRIRQQGFPMRMPYDQFVSRFGPLLQYGRMPVARRAESGRPRSRTSFFASVLPRSNKPTIARQGSKNFDAIWEVPESLRERTAIVLQAGGISMEGDARDAALGTAMVLLRNKILPRLDAKQAEVSARVTLLQKSQRRLSPRRRFLALRRAARCVQSYQRRRRWRWAVATLVRRFRRRVRALAMVARAVQVVRVMTSPAVRAELRRRSASALVVQSGGRGMRARTTRRWLALERRQSASILKLQRNWRVFLLFRYLKSHRLMALRINKISRGRMARKDFRRKLAAALTISRLTRGLLARRRLHTSRRAAAAIQRRARGAAARQRAAARWRGLCVLQRWFSSNHFKLLVKNLFGAARRGDGAYLSAVLDERPELWLVRSQQPSRPTLLHAASAGGALATLQQLVAGAAEALLERPASLQEAAQLCLHHAALRDVSGGSCAHAAAEAAQLEALEWQLLTACAVAQGSMRTYIDLRALADAVQKTDAHGCTLLHRCIGATAAQSGNDGGRRRFRLACWLLQHGAELDCPGPPDATPSNGAPQVVLHALRSALLAAGGPSHLALARQLVGSAVGERAEQWMQAVWIQAALVEGSVGTTGAAQLQEHQQVAAAMWQQHALVSRPEVRGGLGYLQLWLENIDAADDAGGLVDGERRYVTVEPLVEAEGSLLTGGPTLRPVFNNDGTPWVRSKPSLEEPLGLPVHETAEKLTYWYNWRSPALLEGWERALLLLRYYGWTPGGKPTIRGWAYVRLDQLNKQQPFHLQMRAPPVPSRPRDLQRGHPLSAWIHGSISLAMGGAATSTVARFFADKSLDKGSPVPSTRHSRSSSAELSEPPEEQNKPMSARDAKELFAQITRPTKKGDPAAQMGAYKTLMELGGLANEVGHTQAALRSFEAAFRLQPDDGVAFLSATNMRLKLGQTALAKELYTWLLQQPRLQLPPHAAAMAVRKLKSIK